MLAPGYRAIGEPYLDQLHLPHWLMWITCAAEVGLAIVVAVRPPGWILTLAPAAMVVAFTMILAVHDPWLLVHPVGVLSKNIPILAMIVVSFEVHRRGWTPFATRLLRGGMAIVWLTEGVFPKILFQQEWELDLAATYIPWLAPSIVLYVIGTLQAASAILALALRGNALRTLLAGQLAALIVLPILVGVIEPELFVHPFGPLTKNLPIIAGTFLAITRVPPSPFLRAVWKRLCMFHFRVPHELARKHLPPGVLIDEHEGSAWASFVSLEFERTRVLGLPWPGHVRFMDVNLRLYVRHGDDHGVVFVREIVPLPLASFVARTIFGEPFVSLPMRTTSTRGVGSGIRVVREIIQGARTHRIDLETEGEAYVPDASSETAFFKERYFAFGESGHNLRSIRIEHPPWAVRDIREASLDVDFRALYGDGWGEVLERGPVSKTFAEGSAVVVLWPEVK